MESEDEFTVKAALHGFEEELRPGGHDIALAVFIGGGGQYWVWKQHDLAPHAIPEIAAALRRSADGLEVHLKHDVKGRA